ncbi:MAG: glycosyltransferase [Ignavibacteriaceae bacterium]|nr:glycosyltransferase [Ignavibacteriaceae bacterium]
MTTLIITLMILLAISYLIQFIALKLTFRDNDFAYEKNRVGISVIIAAKNEENNLNTLAKYLNNQNYLKDFFEVIIVDDNSNDSTFSIANNLADKIDNLKVIKNYNAILPGKRGALQCGIENSKYDFILITDADCEPDINWITAYSNKFNFGYEFLIGISPFRRIKGKANLLASFENYKNMILSFSLIKLGLPYTAAARNIGFTKELFHRINGYYNTIDTLSGDDDLLLREAVKNKAKIGAVTDTESSVYSDAKKTLSEYMEQRSTLGGRIHVFAKNCPHIWHILNLVSDYSIVLTLIDPLFGFLFLTKIFFTFLIKINFENRFGYKFTLWEFLYGEIVYSELIVVHFINSLIKQPKWK